HNKCFGLQHMTIRPYAGGSEEQDGLSILQYADDTLNNSDWKIWMEREAYLSYSGSRENRLLSLINEDGIATVATVLATVPLNYITCSVDLTNSGQFTVQSMYMSIINNGNINIFMWYLLKGVVAVSVAFHLFINCHVAHFITNVYLFAGLRCIDHFSSKREYIKNFPLLACMHGAIHNNALLANLFHLIGLSLMP
ncbi:hypothetical protein ACJX0J_032801, partial [Zea mays]